MPETYYDVFDFKFVDITRHWGRERLVHEILISRELARGIIREGLRFQSADPKWTKSSESFRGYPLIGYSARQDLPPILIRATALEHLLAVERGVAEVEPLNLKDECVTRHDFKRWLIQTGRPMPAFWYGPEERYVEAQQSNRAVAE